MTSKDNSAHKGDLMTQSLWISSLHTINTTNNGRRKNAKDGGSNTVHYVIKQQQKLP